MVKTLKALGLWSNDPVFATAQADEMSIRVVRMVECGVENSIEHNEGAKREPVKFDPASEVRDK